MNKEKLFEQIRKKKSFLCVGLDPDITKMPKFFEGYANPLLEFNKAIIGATHEFAIAYKPNFAFYERYGSHGIHQLELTLQHIRMNFSSETFVIADAKRGDIGNTSTMYAKAFFDSKSFNYDAVTVAPYMGSDSVEPFLEFPDKWAILLALTSNKGAEDFQTVKRIAGEQLHIEVISKSKTWKNAHNLMYVVGATKAEMLGKIRQLVPNSFLLVPGVGAQGGSLEEVAKYGMNNQCGLIVNSSRDIIYAGEGIKFWETVKDVAWKKYQQPMEALLRKRELI